MKLLLSCVLIAAGALTVRPRPAISPASAAAPPGWFVFDPGEESPGRAALDLRSLNEKVAGEDGFIQARGDAFVHSRTGQPIRFWGVDIGHRTLEKNRADLDRLARHLAKVGVNLVRLHGPLWREDDVAAIDSVKLGKIHQLVAALRGQGIYLELSTYFPAWLSPKGTSGLEGYDGSQNSFAIPFFSARFQELQKGWWKAALLAPNPYTGRPLAEDPTLAFMEILNEDSLFFWTFEPYKTVPAAQMAILEARFGRWLGARYGSLDGAFRAWAKTSGAASGGIRGDDVSAGRAGILRIWDIVHQPSARARDTVEFLAGVQRDYFEGMTRFLKQGLGFKGAVTGSNWITGDDRLLGPLDKWSNTACDFMDHHGYFGGPHQGPRAGYLLSAGDLYDDASALLFQTGKDNDASFDLPLRDVTYDGKPSAISEINWLPPNRYRADLPVLAAAYGDLQGTDAIMFFADDEVEWTDQIRKFSITDPAVMGQFPATALIFRKGLVHPGEVVARTEAKLSDLYALAAPHDPVDPLAYLVGQVHVDVGGSAGGSRLLDLSRWIDRKRKVVRSSTGELTWNYDRGFAIVDSPGVQGMTGFLARAGAVDLTQASLQSELEYGSILVVAMDGLPVKRSRKMLLQVMSEDQNTGWSAPGAGLRRIADVGGPPLRVRELAGRISLKRPDAGQLRVTPLDARGRRGSMAVRRDPDGAVELLPTTSSYLIETACGGTDCP